MEVNTREIARQLRLLPQTEVNSYCIACGMTDRERNATIDYLYYHVSTAVLLERLSISRSTFIRHEKILAYRLLRYMVSNGIITEIGEGRRIVSDLVEEKIFGM